MGSPEQLRPFSRSDPASESSWWFGLRGLGTVELCVSHGAHADLEFLIQFLCFPGPKVIGVHHHGLKSLCMGVYIYICTMYMQLELQMVESPYEC